MLDGQRQLLRVHGYQQNVLVGKDRRGADRTLFWAKLKYELNASRVKWYITSFARPYRRRSTYLNTVTLRRTKKTTGIKATTQRAKCLVYVRRYEYPSLQNRPKLRNHKIHAVAAQPPKRLLGGGKRDYYYC